MVEEHKVQHKYFVLQKYCIIKTAKRPDISTSGGASKHQQFKGLRDKNFFQGGGKVVKKSTVLTTCDSEIHIVLVITFFGCVCVGGRKAKRGQDKNALHATLCRHCRKYHLFQYSTH